MASELRVNTLKDAAGNNSVGMSTVANGSAKAWVNFNGTGTLAVRDSFSISSVTDGGTGDFPINFSASFANANYSAIASGSEDASGTGTLKDRTVIPRTLATNSLEIYNYSGPSSGQADFALNFSSYFGDLA
jgi:hypothetical protein